MGAADWSPDRLSARTFGCGGGSEQTCSGKPGGAGEREAGECFPAYDDAFRAAAFDHTGVRLDAVSPARHLLLARAIAAISSSASRPRRDTGHVTILTELVTGGLTDPGLGAQVATRVHPWVQLAEEAIRHVVPTAALLRRMPVKELAYAIVALFLGLELLGQLTGDHSRGAAVVRRLTSGRGLPRIDTAQPHSDRP